MAPLKILVVGAGIAGNAVAFWVAKLGHSVTVMERHPDLRVNGLQLDLRGKGIEVMKRMGLEQAVRAKCVPEKGMELVDSTGQRRAFFPANTSGKGAQSISSEFEIMRGDLCRVLHDAAVERGATYRFDISVESYVESSDGDGGASVEVKLLDGTTERFDLVVGCDGQGSRIRRLMQNNGILDSDHTDPALTTLSERIAYYTVPSSNQEGEQYIATAYLMPEKRFLLLRRHREDQIQVYLTADTKYDSGQLEKMKRGDVKSEKETFADLFTGGGWRTDEMVEALKEGADDFYCQYSGVVRLDSLSRGRVTLVGDAGYGCPPDGTGTSMAILGAYVLAGEIGQSCPSGERAAATRAAAARATGTETETATETEPKDIGNDEQDGVLSALNAYEDKFHPFMTKLHKGYSADPSYFDKIPWTPLTVSLFNHAMSIASFLRLDRIASRLMPAESSKGWDMPVYVNMDCS